MRYAVVAQFFYCGAQVGIWSLLVDFAKEAADVPARTGATVYLFATMIAFCAGRFFGAWLQRYYRSRAATGDLLRLQHPALRAWLRRLGGFPTIIAMVATSFFMSIMFPTIFALGIGRLGHETEFASSFIVMAISGARGDTDVDGVGGGPYRGRCIGALFLPALCYVVVMSFAAAGARDGTSPAT